MLGASGDMQGNYIHTSLASQRAMVLAVLNWCCENVMLLDIYIAHLLGIYRDE